MIDLGARAVACRRWQWMPGMLVISAGHRYRMTEETIALGPGDLEWQKEWMRPVLTDPATLGCLLALVREARGDPTAYAATSWCGIPRRTEWWVNGPTLMDGYATEAEALVAALEAAP